MASIGKTAFVLAGGGSLGAVQAGMLAALCDAGTVADFVVGASAGAVNAGFFAAEPSLEGARAMGAAWRGVTRADVMPLTFGNALNVVMRRGYLFHNGPLRSLLERHIHYARLEDAAVPVHIVASDVLTGDEVVLSQGPVIDAILASAAIPGVFPPVRIDGRDLVDGGVANNTPISTAIRLGARHVIVLPTGFACALSRPPSGAAARAMNAISHLVARQLVADIEHYGAHARISVVPCICPNDVSPYDYSSCAGLVDRAETIARAWIEGGGLKGSGVVPEMLHEHRH
ncbi:MAG: patatin-like phospholipase family protein [Roseiarcus sp.]